MSVKRTATTDLNHENWDEEDTAEPEEMGGFKAAPKDVLEKRVIRTAKRRSHASGDEAKRGVFSGFGGFNKTQPPSFDFLANLTNGSKNTNGTSTKSDTAVTSSLFSSKPAVPTGGLFGTNPPSTTSATPFGTTFQTSSFASTAKTEIPSMTFTGSKADSTVSDSPFKIQSVSSSADTNTEKRTATTISSTIFGVSSTSTNQTKSLTTNTSPFKQPVSSTSTAVQNSTGIATQSNSNRTETADNKPETEKEKARNKYYSRLKGLNESVSSWIVKHVAKTPLCFLTPIFKDYENYLHEIQAEYEAAKLKDETMTKEAQNKPDTSNAPTVQSSVFTGTNTGSSLFSNSPKSVPLKTNDATNASTGFAFGNTSASNSVTASPTGLTLSTTTPTKGFSFGITSNAATTQTKSASSFTITTSTSTATPSKGFSFGITTPTQAATSTTNSSPFNTSSTPSKGFSFGSTSTPTSASLFNASNAASSDTTPSKGFSFGITSTPCASTLTNSSTTTLTSSAPFSFGIGSGKPFSFSPQTQQQNTVPPKNDEEDDQPPKVEYTPVVEENSVFDKRCKIFVKKDGNFVDKGVGTLYIKKIEESGKHQLLVRANTNLGTVLLNLILASAIPIQRMGKNNVMLACIPTPDAKPPPTPVLIRVKTGEEADELLETLNKYKS